MSKSALLVPDSILHFPNGQSVMVFQSCYICHGILQFGSFACDVGVPDVVE